MKKLLVIVDFNYLFHRHLYAIRNSEEKARNLAGGSKDDGVVYDPLSYKITEDGVEKNIPMSRIYMPLKDIEAIAKAAGDLVKYKRIPEAEDVDMVICMDSRSERKDENAEYKSNRKGLNEIDLDSIRRIKELLVESGYTVFQQEGIEADDLVQSIVRKLIQKEDCKYCNILIYTPDMDLAAVVSEGVGLVRYKSASKARNVDLFGLTKHELISANNFENKTLEEYGVVVPFNSIMLFKCTVGDKSDCIKGIDGFGPVAFSKVATKIRDKYGCDIFKGLNNAQNVKEILLDKELFSEEQSEQALQSLELVRGREVDIDLSLLNCGLGDNSKKKVAYMKYQMKSLLKFE